MTFPRMTFGLRKPTRRVRAEMTKADDTNRTKQNFLAQELAKVGHKFFAMRRSATASAIPGTCKCSPLLVVMLSCVFGRQSLH